MKNLCKIYLSLLLSMAIARSATMSIDSISGPVTQNEINSFITYMNSQSPPPTPWGTLNGTGHNAWADGSGGRDLEAMGEMFIVSSNMTILNKMINWADDCTSQRNDLMSTNNGGQRVMWTGLIDKVWVPNWPTDMTDDQSQYCGCESEDTVGHIAFCAKLILQTPAIWNTTVPDGNPYGYGATYFQRATNYLAKCDEANDEYFLKWFIKAGSNLIVAPTNAAWIAVNENVNAINRQMMFMSGFQRLAEAHELLGDNPARVTQYDAIVKTNVTVCLNGMKNFHPYTKNGQPVYDWGYYPTSNAPEATEIHAEYDIIGVWRAFNRVSYGFTLSPLVPFANTMVNVIYLGTNTFAGDVDAGSGVQSPVYSGWILPADWNPQNYTCVVGVAYTNGWYKSSADIEAGMLFMKNRRYLKFSVTPSPASKIVQAGNAANYTLTVAPLGGSTNAVGLAVNNLPSGATANFSSSSVNCAALTLSSTNLTLSIQTSVSTPTGTYLLSIVSTNGSVSHTNIVNLVVGNFSVSANPSSQTISPGSSTSYTINVATNTGFSGTVSFGLGGLPANCSASFNPTSVNGASSSTLSVVASNSATAGNYTLTIFGTNGATVASTTAMLQIVGTATPIWNGGSSSGNYWNDSANWSGISPSANGPLLFGGSARLNNTNNTTAGTTYSNIIFNSGAGAFLLNGNSLALNGNITNNSSSQQTIALALNYNSSCMLEGGSGGLVIAGGWNDIANTGTAITTTLSGAGTLANNFSTPASTNILLTSPTANWTIADNATSASNSFSGALNIYNGGTLNFGTMNSAPTLMLTGNDGTGTGQRQFIGNGTGTSTLNIVNGTLTFNDRLNVGTGTAGAALNVSGGILNVAGQGLSIADNNVATIGSVTVSGGLLHLNAGTLFVATRGSGTLTVDDGEVDARTLDVSRNASGVGSMGVVNLNGGTLTADRVSTATSSSAAGGSPTAVFNFDGGTLKATSASATWFQGGIAGGTQPIPISAIVKPDGAIIDDGGNIITIAEPLRHDSSLGAAADGGLTKLGGGTLNLIATNSYNGGTFVNGGTLALSGAASVSNSAVISVSTGATLDASVRNGGALTIVSGQTLTGSGTVKGNITIANGATLAPGGSLSTLAFNNNLTLNGGGTTLVEISDSPTTNDAANVIGNLILNGTLVVTNAGGNFLTAGDSFKLFNAASFSGAFTNVIPVVPQPGLKWDTSALTNGVLKIAAAPLPAISAISVSGNNFAISGTNGQVGETYWLLASTNLALPLTNWTVVSTNTFDASGDFNFTNSPDPSATQSFYLLQLQ